MDYQKLITQSQELFKKLEQMEVWQLCIIGVCALLALVLVITILVWIFKGLGRLLFGSKRSKRSSRSDPFISTSSLAGSDTIMVTNKSNSARPKRGSKTQTITSPDDAIDFIYQVGGRIGKNRENKVVLVFLNGTDVRDVHVKILRYLKNVESVHLRRTKVTDACLSDLEILPNLRFLYITETNITTEGIEEIKAKRPTLKVED